MTHTYHIKGMTCRGCKASVENYLNYVEDVTKVAVNLEKENAEVTMSRHIPTEALQRALPKKYTLSEIRTKDVFQTAANTSNTVKKKSKLQQLQPLLLLLFYITAASFLLHYNPWDGHAIMLDFMGLFFIVLSFFKMLDLKNFPESFGMYDPLAKRVPLYGWLYPFIETALGLMFLMRFEIKTALITTLIVLSITTLGVTKTLLDKKVIQCACLGTILKLPITEATFIENAIMITMAIIML